MSGDPADSFDQFAPELSAVGGTALIISNCRARLSRLENAWFVDPLAVYLSSRNPDWDAWDLSRGLIAWVAVRTRFLDELVLQSVRRGLRQVVLLGAGLDARAFRLDLPADLRCYEVDRSDVLDIKERTVVEAGLHSQCARRVVAADLLDPQWLDRLQAGGWEPTAGTVWIAEGLLIYFEQQQREALLRDLRRAGSDRDVLGATMAAREVAPDHPMWRPQQVSSPISWFAECGWAATIRTMAEVSADYGRPLMTPGRGRAGLIRAVPTGRGTPR